MVRLRTDRIRTYLLLLIIYYKDLRTTKLCTTYYVVVASSNHGSVLCNSAQSIVSVGTPTELQQSSWSHSLHGQPSKSQVWLIANPYYGTILEDCGHQGSKGTCATVGRIQKVDSHRVIPRYVPDMYVPRDQNPEDILISIDDLRTLKIQEDIRLGRRAWCKLLVHSLH